MNNYSTSNPNYNSPSQQPTASGKAAEQARNAAKIAQTLDRTQTSTGASSSGAVDNTYIPMAYTNDTSAGEALQYSMYLQFKAEDYSNVYETADMIVKNHKHEAVTPEEEILLYLWAINQAIAEKIRPDQTAAEGANSSLVKAKHEEGEVVINSAEAKTHNTEVCVHKSAIAKHYLDTQGINSYIHIDPKDSHMFIMIGSHKFHPNSPLQTADGYIPHVETMTAEQQAFFTRLQQNNNETKTGKRIQLYPYAMAA